MNYRDFYFVRRRRIELLSHPWQGRVLPLNQHRNNVYYFNIKLYFYKNKYKSPILLSL